MYAIRSYYGLLDDLGNAIKFQPLAPVNGDVDAHNLMLSEMGQKGKGGHGGSLLCQLPGRSAGSFQNAAFVLTAAAIPRHSLV